MNDEASMLLWIVGGGILAIAAIFTFLMRAKVG